MQPQYPAGPPAMGKPVYGAPPPHNQNGAVPAHYGAPPGYYPPPTATDHVNQFAREIGGAAQGLFRSARGHYNEYKHGGRYYGPVPPGPGYSQTPYATGAVNNAHGQPYPPPGLPSPPIPHPRIRVNHILL